MFGFQSQFCPQAEEGTAHESAFRRSLEDIFRKARRSTFLTSLLIAKDVLSLGEETPVSFGIQSSASLPSMPVESISDATGNGAKIPLACSCHQNKNQPFSPRVILFISPWSTKTIRVPRKREDPAPHPAPSSGADRRCNHGPPMTTSAKQYITPFHDCSYAKRSFSLYRTNREV